MSFIRQKLRPKHQVLILKCYPQTVKGAVDVKPNSSELSYLLYYATNRRSKLQKVGAFLEKKTESDVYKARIGNVQVTLQILAALVEKAPRDLPLYAPFLLRILNVILNSSDITMVESSVITFQVFCEYHDTLSLSADQGYLRLYEETIRKYAAFASPTFAQSRGLTSRPLAVRWRTAGLQAIKSVASSEALASVAGRQLDIIMPALLDNIWTTDLQTLASVVQKVRREDNTTEKVRRMSATAQTNEATRPTDLTSLATDTVVADKLAEEEVQVLAMSCLRQMFVKNNRSQIRAVTVSHIKYVSEKMSAGHSVTTINDMSGDDRGWATTIFMLIARWTPVQDRYVILVTAMDSLVRLPMIEENMMQQMVLAIMVDALLRSDINLIGLSVMDVLVGLIQHILRLLQLDATSPGSRFYRETPSSLNDEHAPTANGKAIVPSTTRERLLERLEQCVGDLATHIYYADQISDMISALFLRLKPPVNSAVSSPVAAIENPEAATAAIITSGHIIEDSDTDGFFSFDTAKITALSAIKSILDVATRKNAASGAVSLGRSRVGLRVWDGTQWLLRDTDGRVRKAYVDALLTWLEKEMTRDDLRAMEEKTPHRPGRSLTRNAGDDSSLSLARRAVSNASRSEKPIAPVKTSFLQLLHLAVYENAVQYAESEADILLLHLLLSTLVNKLGVNAISSGLPMIFRLQEDIQEVETLAKVRIGSICHGYFWMITDAFDFENSAIGHEIRSEIIRRREDAIWVESIRVPPIPIGHVGIVGTIDDNLNLPLQALESLVLKPFDDRETMVELIALSYSESMASPPSSPPTSPTRGTSRSQIPHIKTSSPSSNQVPAHLREAMLSEWSKEAVLAHVQLVGRAASLAASRAGTQTTGRHFLGVLGNGGGTGTSSRNQSPPQQQRSSSQTYSLTNGRQRQKTSRMHNRDQSPTQYSDSSRNSTARFEHLKRVLAGQAPPSRHGFSAGSDGSSESLVSYDGSQSEFSLAAYNSSVVDASSIRRGSEATTRSKSRDRRASPELVIRPMPQPRALSDVHEVSTPVSQTVPPVPPLPEGLASSSPPYTFTAQEFSFTDPSSTNSDQPRISKSRGGQSTYAPSTWGSMRAMDDSGGMGLNGGLGSGIGSGGGGGLDLESLLKGIDTKSNVGALGNVAKPPY